MATGADDIEIVTLRLGFDRFEARLVTEACRDQGLTVELMAMYEDGQHLLPLTRSPHKLLARSDELDEVQQILARSGYGAPPA